MLHPRAAPALPALPALMLALTAGLACVAGVARADAPPLQPAAVPGAATNVFVAQTAFPADVTRSAPSALPRRHGAWFFDRAALRAVLAAAPTEQEVAAGAQPLVLALPMPDGTLSRYLVSESPILAPELQAQHPDIRTYRAVGLDDPHAVGRFDLTPLGLCAMLRTTEGVVVIQPYAEPNDLFADPARLDGHTFSFFMHHATPRSAFECVVPVVPDAGAPAAAHGAEPAPSSLASSTTTPAAVPASAPTPAPGSINGAGPDTLGPTFRTFRLAVTTPGEFTEL